MTVYWVVWDGAAPWIAERLCRTGALPALSALRKAGVTASARVPSPNCQTPPSLATLFTGRWPAEHGVTGFTIPSAAEGGRVDDHASAFTPGVCRAPLVWEQVAEYGARSALVHAPWVLSAAGTVEAHIDGAVEAYSRRIARADALPLRTRCRAAWRVGPYELAIASQENVVVSAGTQQVQLIPDGNWRPLRLGDSSGVWLRAMSSARDRLLLRTGAWTRRVAGSNARLVDAFSRTPVFNGEGLGAMYRGGAFGARMAEGGDGSAEQVFLSSVECAARGFATCADAALASHSADLVVIYLPMTDDLGHELAGWCDEISGAYRADIAPQLWRCLARGWGWADRVLARVMRRAERHDSVILSADHGMVGMTHLVHLNRALVDAGLARIDGAGRLDAADSAAVYHPANNGSLWINHERLAGGWAGLGDVASVQQLALAALSAIIDPATGRPVVAGYLGADGRPLPACDSESPVYVVLADDYQPSAELPPGEAVVRRARKTGAHVVNTGSDRLHATLAAAGPGIPADLNLGLVENTLPAELVLDQIRDSCSNGRRRARAECLTKVAA